ncbi:hypothetical protein BJ741DRAFT_675735 [Chytriomyces cf. hyalinus JEL632]|nr:hypothetical protein BJ741DRAFT_675735 [Chytriomyces cf. hyalinus JEL632]
MRAMVRDLAGQAPPRNEEDHAAAAATQGVRALVTTASNACDHAAFRFWTKVEATVQECEDWKVSSDMARRYVAEAMGESTLGNRVDTTTHGKICRDTLEEAKLEQARASPSCSRGVGAKPGNDFAIGELLTGWGTPMAQVLSTTYVLLVLGDVLGLSFGRKSQVVPSAEPVYLGFIVLLAQPGLEPTKRKREEFLALLRSFITEATGGLAFTREQYRAIAEGERGSHIIISSNLRSELTEWLCLDLESAHRWVGAKWLSAKHATIEVCLETDANDHRIGAALIEGGRKSLMGEVVPDWMLPGAGVSINVREAQALLAAISVEYQSQVMEHCLLQ